MMKKSLDKNILLVSLCIFIVHMIVWVFSGNSPLSPNPYNSYVLQAQAWADGSFDLGRNYSHLELAFYDYRYFVSFPPFPSVLYFPFVLIGLPVFDGLFALAFSIAGAVITYLILRRGEMSDTNALIYALLFTCGSNLLFVSTNAWVWFIAQNMCYTLTAAAVYFAMRKKGFLCFLMWSFAVGCRPFQILYLPLLCLILMKQYGNGVSLLFRKWSWFSGAAVMAVFYMWLNYSRFGNIFEFGHNYLPEFTQAAHGQFSPYYLKANLYSLIRFPQISDGKLVMQRFDGMNMFLASPVFAVAVYCAVKGLRKDGRIVITALVTILAELLCIALHKTMGGWQFGNRYTNDCLVAATVIIAFAYRKKQVSYPLALLAVYGVLFNTAGSILCYLNV